MSKTLVIDPVTRIEGHGKVTLQLDDNNEVTDARLQVVEFRGFERFIQGHPYWEAPMLLQRICGICFVSHHLCGAKALDDMVGVGLKDGIPMLPTPEKIRRLGHYAQQLQSHVTAYFYLIAPEMVFGIESAPEKRNVLGLAEANPELVKRVIQLRKWGQELIVSVLGKRMHGISSIPGGVNSNLSIQERDKFLNGNEDLLSIDAVIDYAQDALNLFYQYHEEHREEIDRFGVVKALDMCLVDENGDVDYYHGKIRVVDENKQVVLEIDYHDYLEHFAEATESWSYMKFPYLKALGREAGSVRVGPLARLNVTRRYHTPLAQKALERFHAYTEGKSNNMTLHTNWARAIEILHSAELIKDLLNDPDLQGENLIITPAKGAWTGEGVGVVEAPRGTLLHHYRADETGNMTFANLIVSTTQNNKVINRTVQSVAQDWISGKPEITEGMMNAIEVGIRAYDPCLSCATHAMGQMPLQISLLDTEGHLIDEKFR
ncbi:Ni/Fe hydrogenase subunit alpha [Enterovibrio nigricans]|uniref:NAD(P)-dependent nickel-iron dehydrogenase catalytic subunit n=1 Tax=Enterovibrio nigricans DSM 22720 TaxID=1121868 RepID=A0A1T4UYL7_9GAMM|nr:Ni/Fe hydrogenase subunit alpha [Enterovibrio nigricans]PKF50080.1 Ni/Fe hydrogenase subunit alpha [Enterovibrio nigricans]SKA57833.1 NAD(P)-dependent nickel-iron dehydrogenase catalytic subunit [Enterovibrio nigricans DSM 22720]